MDIALQCFMEAQSYIDSFYDIPLSDMIFEETEEVKEKIEHNEKAKNGALSSIGKMIDALINMVKELMNKITNFIREGFLSKDERAKYKNFKEMVKSNPDLASKKVTIEDWRAYEKAYDDALKKLEEEANKPNPSLDIANGIVEALSKTIESYASEGTDIAARVAIQTTLDTAIDIADKNVTCAKAINFALQNELIKLDNIKEQIGEKEVAKFEKKIDRLSRAGAIHRIRVKLFNRKEATLQGILKKQFNRLLSYTNIKNGKLEDGKPIADKKSLLKGMSKNPKFTTQALGGAENAAKLAQQIATDTITVKRNEKEAKKSIKNAKRDIQDLKNFIGIKKK